MQSCVRNGWKIKYASLMMNHNTISQHLENNMWFDISHRHSGKESPYLLTGDSRDMGRTPGSGRSPGRGNSNPLQHSCLENSSDRGDWQATVHGVSKSQTGLSTHTHTHTFCEMYSIVLGPSELNEVLVAQSCPTLCDPRDCSLTDFPVHGILQARILAWLAIPFSRGSSLPRGWTQVSWIAGRFFTTWSAREVNNRNYSLWVVLFNGKIEKGNMLMFTCILRINMH